METVDSLAAIRALLLLLRTCTTKVLLEWGKSVILGVVYFSYCNFIWYSNLCKCNPFLVFSTLITSVMCMEVVSRGYLLAYTNTSWHSFCFHCLSAPPALAVWKMQDIPCCLILYFPLCLAAFSLPPPQSLRLAYFTPPCLRAAHKWVLNAHTCTDICTHVYIRVYEHIIFTRTGRTTRFTSSHIYCPDLFK